MPDPYRTLPAPLPAPIGPRWGVTSWPRFYVRVARHFIDLRGKYRYGRAYKRYERRVDEWVRVHGNQVVGNEGRYILVTPHQWIRAKEDFSLLTAVPPFPLPPPKPISE